MIIECSACQKKYNIDENKIPAGAKQAKCKACGENIFINPIPASPSPRNKKLPATSTKSCPKCGHQLVDEPKQNECPACGIIFNKYKGVAKPRRNTNLIDCLVCKKEVSKNAKSCPYCGEPIKKELKELSEEQEDLQKLGGGCLLLILGCFFIFLVYVMFTSSNPNETVSNSALDGSVYQVERYLKQTLKDPDSFQAIEWSPVQKEDTGYIVRCKYRAKNSFGGYVIENQIFILDKSGNVLSVVGQ